MRTCHHVAAVCLFLACASGCRTMTRFHTVPPGAKVYLDGRLVGHTPTGPNLVAAGRYAVAVKGTGYALWERDLEVGAGRRSSPHVRLEKALYSIEVLDLPSGASLYLDGLPVELEDGWLTGLGVGDHELTAHLDGHKSWRRRVTVGGRGSSRVRAHLPELRRPASARPVYRVGTAVLSLAGLTAAGILLVQAGDDSDYLLPGLGAAAVGVAAAAYAVPAWLDYLGEEEAEGGEAGRVAVGAGPGWVVVGGRF